MECDGDSGSSGAVKFVVPLEQVVDDGSLYPPYEREGLFGIAAPDGTLYVDSIPFFARNINYRDRVRTHTRPGDGVAWLAEIVERGGHSTFRLARNAQSSTEAEFEFFLGLLMDLGCTFERSAPIIAVDVPPDDAETIVALILAAEDEGAVEIDVGYDASGLTR